MSQLYDCCCCCTTSTWYSGIYFSSNLMFTPSLVKIQQDLGQIHQVESQIYQLVLFVGNNLFIMPILLCILNFLFFGGLWLSEIILPWMGIALKSSGRHPAEVRAHQMIMFLSTFCHFQLGSQSSPFYTHINCQRIGVLNMLVRKNKFVDWFHLAHIRLSSCFFVF